MKRNIDFRQVSVWITRMSLKLTLSVAFSLLLLSTVWILLSFPDEPLQYDYDVPVVLSWSKFFGQDFTYVLLHHENWPTCPRECVFTSDKRLLNVSSVILFHAWNFYGDSFPSTSPNQLKVFFSQEAPTLTSRSYFRRFPKDYFNITSSYRLDSDIPMPYGTFQKLKTTKTDLPVEIEEALKKKQFLAFQLISNCYTHSRREVIGRELKKHANITSYGRCFSATCDKDCEAKAIESHYFYLAFENAVCNDYVTEKFFRLRHGIVPVVLSRKVVEKIAPKGSFIVVDDFESVELLVAYLVRLTRSPEEYRKYFE
ncbi:hypothetical protein L596_029967 [Steinernema carpocapsae]|uniref:Fucosyltransferase n=1 Tax=Steinernema carpocapsae TaxID=34508 RepID=A0A4U5LRC1_STECR|nr:hypothetical protein L596_029967 [Steinernema carpocapsae]